MVFFDDTASLKPLEMAAIAGIIEEFMEKSFS
jgi:hypothetical protein